MQTSAHDPDLFGDATGDVCTCPVAAMLERTADPASRSRILALGKHIAAMQKQGYEIGTPAKVRSPTKFSYAEWHIPVKHAGVRCVLSFFLNETIEPDHEQHTRQQRTAARRS